MPCLTSWQIVNVRISGSQYCFTQGCHGLLSRYYFTCFPERVLKIRFLTRPNINTFRSLISKFAEAQTRRTCVELPPSKYAGDNHQPFNIFINQHNIFMPVYDRLVVYNFVGHELIKELIKTEDLHASYQYQWNSCNHQHGADN